MASRTSTKSRGSSPGTARSSKSRSVSSRTTPKKAARKPSRSPARPGPVPRALAGVGRGIGRIWVAIAHLLGSITRSIGQGAKDLEPELRRDGLGLALIAGAAILIAATWFGGRRMVHLLDRNVGNRTYWSARLDRAIADPRTRVAISAASGPKCNHWSLNDWDCGSSYWDSRPLAFSSRRCQSK